MTSDWRIWLLFGAFGVTLILNIVALGHISDLRSELEDVRRQASEVRNLQAQLVDAERRMSDIAEEQVPIGDLTWEIDEHPELTCEDEMPLLATWSFRELPANADVQLEFSRVGSDGWIQVQAERIGAVDYQAIHTLPMGEDWEFRIVATGDEQTLATDPQPASQLHQFTDKRVLFEEGESRSMNGKRWVRYIVAPVSPLESPCNEILGASLTVLADGESVAVAEFANGHPGDHLPAGYDEDRRESAEHSSVQHGITFDTAPPAPGSAVTPREDDYWWTDWIEIEGPVEPAVEIHFGDGTSRTVDRIGIGQ